MRPCSMLREEPRSRLPTPWQRHSWRRPRASCDASALWQRVGQNRAKTIRLRGRFSSDPGEKKAESRLNNSSKRSGSVMSWLASKRVTPNKQDWSNLRDDPEENPSFLEIDHNNT